MAAKLSIRRVEKPSWVMLPASRGLSRPPTRTQLQLLPFHELEWDNFERLCYRLAKNRGDVDQWAVLYGARGRKQEGIDIYARRPNATLYSCWQSKQRKLTVALLKATIQEFETGAWAQKSEEFIICSSGPIQDNKLQNEIERQTHRLLGNNLILKVLGETELSAELKNRSKLVRDFFGRDWVNAFCEDSESAYSQESLDADDIGTLRAELHKLYAGNFSGTDPGILVPATGHSNGSRLLSILDRFVEPDIEITDTNIADARPTIRRDPPETQASDLKPNRYDTSSSSPPSRDILRRRISAWVAEGDHTVIAGEAGFGKSAALRAFALDLLEYGRRFPPVAQRWADCVPIVMPFAFWVRIVAEQEIEIALPNAIEIWFRKFHISERLLMLILRSLRQKKVLLLLDGLDEWSNEIAARSTLILLNTYINMNSIPTIVTGRPSGLARLGALDPLWRQGRLAALSDSQQRALTTIWFNHLYRSDDSHAPAGTRAQAVKIQIGNFFTDLGQSGTLATLSGVPLLLSGLISLYISRSRCREIASRRIKSLSNCCWKSIPTAALKQH